jgi:hypothetical protein
MISEMDEMLVLLLSSLLLKLQRREKRVGSALLNEHA